MNARWIALLAVAAVALAGSASAEERGIDENFFRPGGALERNAGAPTLDAPAPAPSYGWISFKIAVVLGGFLLAFWGLYRLAVRAKIPLVRTSALVRRLGVEPLAPDRWIHVVEVGGKVMLLGVTPASITHLATLEGEAADAVRLAASRAAAGEGGGFLDRLKESFGGGEVSTGTAAEGLRRERDRLRTQTL